jgi:murein DD-endopeptidase MepM/ murein hydrolase activator NlpD
MAQPIYISADDAQNFSIQYHDFGDPAQRARLTAAWKSFNRRDPGSGQTFKIWIRPTNPTMEVSVDYRLPANAPAGRYRIETFIPGIHAVARQAVYTVSHNWRSGQPPFDSALTLIDQAELYDQWVSLGEYHLDPAQNPLSGRVRQVDLSREDPPVELAFGPVRYIPLDYHPPAGKVRFDSPVGTPEERDGPFPTGSFMWRKYPIWAGQWVDVNPFLNWYSQGYHTGADLNLPGASAADKGKPIYAVSDGVVTYAGRAQGWGYIVVVEHPDALVTLPDGKSRRQVVFSRYGHVEPEIPVRSGQEIARGTLVGRIGLGEGYVSGWHLHFDVCYSDMLRRRPAHWPNLGSYRAVQKSLTVQPRAVTSSKESIMREVLANYVDPLRFISDNH